MGIWTHVGKVKKYWRSLLTICCDFYLTNEEPPSLTSLWRILSQWRMLRDGCSWREVASHEQWVGVGVGYVVIEQDMTGWSHH